MLDQGDTKMPTIEIAVEIEQMSLEAKIAAPEGWAAAEIGDGVMPERVPALLNAGTHGVDASGRAQVVVEHEVRRREADGAAACIAAFDAPLDLPEAPEQRRRLTGVSGCEKLADARRGVDGAPGRRDRTDHGDTEAQIRAARLEQRRRAAPLPAEDEIVADHGVAHAEGADEHGLDEVLRAPGREGEVEMQREQQIDAERLEMPRLGAERRQAKGRVVRPEHTAGVALRGGGRPGGARGPGKPRGPPRPPPTRRKGARGISA